LKEGNDQAVEKRFVETDQGKAGCQNPGRTMV